MLSIQCFIARFQSLTSSVFIPLSPVVLQWQWPSDMKDNKHTEAVCAHVSSGPLCSTLQLQTFGEQQQHTN